MSNSGNNAKSPKKRTLFGKICVDIFAGTIAGINVTLVGHPFDTLKVRLQTQPAEKPIYDGLIDCFKKTLKWEGFGGLYKGVASPLAGQMLFRANLFLAYFSAKRFFSKNDTQKLKPYQMYLAGGIGWGFGALIECPIDFAKTQLQIQIIKSKTIPNFTPEYSGFFDLINKLWQVGGLKTFYQGFLIHLCRNVPAGAFHLGTFELYRFKVAEQKGCQVKDLPIKYSLIAGGIGGILFWAPFYPLDVLKSTIQSDSPHPEQKKYKGIADAAKQLYQQGGYNRFYKGFSPCMLRAIPANSVLLFTSSWISEHL